MITPERLQRFFRGAVALYVVVLAALIGLYIHVSTAQVEVALYIQGPKKWLQSSPSALRGFVMDAPTGRMFSDAIIDINRGEESVAKGRTEGHGFVHLPVKTSLPSGVHNLTFHARHAAIESYTSDVEIEVQKSPDAFEWPKSTSRIVPEKGSVAEVKDPTHTGALRIEPMSPTRELIRGLPNTMWFRVIDEMGHPIEAQVEVLKIDGTLETALEAAVSMRPGGLFSLPLTPITALKMEIKATTTAGLEGTSQIWLTTVAAQFALRMQENFLAPDQKIFGNVDTLTREGGILVDIYADGHWVDASEFRIDAHRAGIAVMAPVAAKLYKVQIYESVFGADNAWDVRYLAAAPSATQAGCQTAMQNTLELMAKGDPGRFGAWAPMVLGKVNGLSAEQCNMVLEALLQAIPAKFEVPPTLLNTRARDEAALKKQIEETQGQILILIVLSLLLGFAIVLVFVARGVMEARSQRQAMFEASLESELEISTPNSGVERLLFTVQVVVLLGTIFLFGAGLVLILGLL